MNTIPYRQIRGRFNESTIRVYQAYSSNIAHKAVEANTLISPFNMGRMTWIKPSFLWMMYRSGWATKEGQEHILAIDITRNEFEWALRNSCLSHFEKNNCKSIEEWKKKKEHSPVRIQWDPERSINLGKLDYRSIQIGLSNEAVQLYVNQWITAISDITDDVKAILSKIEIGDNIAINKIIADEQPYPISDEITHILGIHKSIGTK